MAAKALEAVFRTLAAKGYVKSLPQGDLLVYMFAGNW
jgi:hypothetical protein